MKCELNNALEDAKMEPNVKPVLRNRIAVPVINILSDNKADSDKEKTDKNKDKNKNNVQKSASNNRTWHKFKTEL